MCLFGRIVRTDLEPARFAEPRYNYLNRTARPELAGIRTTLEAWFTRYPSSEKEEMRTRFRSTDDGQHHAAFFELSLHELLLCLGCTVTVHPELGEPTSRRPDFLVESEHGERFYLEAVVASDESREEQRARARMHTVYDTLNRLESEDHFIGMRLRGAPETPPPGRRVQRFLERELASLDREATIRLYRSGGVDALPHWRFSHQGWEIEFFPIPKSDEQRERRGIRPLGLFFHGARTDDPSPRIRGVVLGKAGRYGELDAPYVVAVDVMGFADRTDVVEALFGTERVIATLGPDGPTELVPDRVPDGVWTSPGGPQHTRLSAVLVARRLFPWNIREAPLCLYHNPWAARRYESVLTRLPQAISVEGQLEQREGESLGALLGLPPGWPVSQRPM